MEHFRATEVICDSDDETYFAQWLWPYGGIDFEQGYFVLVRALEPENEDEQTVWASRCSQGFSCYKGIDNVTLYREKVMITLTQRGKEKLGCDDLAIDFSIGETEFAHLSEVMALVFSGLNQLSIRL